MDAGAPSGCGRARSYGRNWWGLRAIAHQLREALECNEDFFLDGMNKLSQPVNVRARQCEP
jgi:hypothetical protein